MTMTNRLPASCRSFIRFHRLLAPALLSALLVTPVYAATFTVPATAAGIDAVDSNPGDGVCLSAGNICTLRAAVQESNALAGADTINIETGVYPLTLTGGGESAAATGDLDISDDVTIKGAGQSATVIDAQNAGDRVMQIFSGTVILQDLTLRNGAVDGEGGGLYIASGATVTINSCTIENNAATSGGAGNGGGIYNAGDLTLNKATVQNNTSVLGVNGLGGGGIFSRGQLMVLASTVHANSTTNTPGASGGGIRLLGATGAGANLSSAIVRNSTVSNNSAELGGGIYNDFARLGIELSVIENNTAVSAGGGLGNFGRTTVSRSVVRNNTSRNANATATQGLGGGVFNAASLDITSTTVHNNTGNLGAGIYNDSQGTLALKNSTVSANAATVASTSEGGGVYNSREIAVFNSTIFDNQASSGGTEFIACGSKDASLGLGCDNAADDVVTVVVNTIVGNSTSTNICGGEFTLVTSNGHNLITADTCQSGGKGLGAAATDIVADPLFATGLQFNDGAKDFLLTFALGDASPAVNAGDNGVCPLNDQRGHSRNDNACDIGAYEISDTVSNEAVADLLVMDPVEVRTPAGACTEVTDNDSFVQNGTRAYQCQIGNNNDQIRFDINLANNGPDDVPQATLRLKLSPGLVVLNPGAVGSGCAATGTGLECAIQNFAAQSILSFPLSVIPDATGTYIVEADISSDNNQPAESFRVDNIRAVEVRVIDNRSATGNGNSGTNVLNFSGSGGGGALDAAAIAVLLAGAAGRRRMRR
ncbi:MAG TPA: hypothetical protein ENJ19_02725 [Gammaproteobacteria bacterium]|nr:hypothetical protein [Gammaproteobacteria bacterium]